MLEKGLRDAKVHRNGISVILMPSQRFIMSQSFIPPRSAPENVSGKISLSLIISSVQ